MLIKTIAVGINRANCYILACEKTKEALIIDPGAEPDKIKKAITKLGVTPKFIINTHGHADHIGANRDFGLPIFIHSLDSDCLTDPYKNVSAFFGFNITSPKAERLLKDGDEMKIGQIDMKIIHTPGHTPGSISILADNIIFTGDTLFENGVGRTDLEGSSEGDLIYSIKNKIFVLGDDVVVCPGHGPSTTIGKEKKRVFF